MSGRLKTLLLLLSLVSPLAAQVDEPRSCEEEYRAVMQSTWMTESDKQLAGFHYRVCGRKALQELDIFDLTDGVDAFEAWYLATLYRVETYGECGLSKVPTRIGTNWEIRFAHGADPLEGPLITVNAATGLIRCDGYPDLTDPMALIHTTLAELRARYRMSGEDRRREILEEAALRKAEIEEALRLNAERQRTAERAPLP